MKTTQQVLDEAEELNRVCHNEVVETVCWLRIQLSNTATECATRLREIATQIGLQPNYIQSIASHNIGGAAYEIAKSILANDCNSQAGFVCRDALEPTMFGLYTACVAIYQQYPGTAPPPIKRC